MCCALFQLITYVIFALSFILFFSRPILQWGAADAEIKVPSDEHAELKGSPFKAWGRSVHSHS